MLELSIPTVELYDDASETFKELPGGEFKLEHSLWAISEWEARWQIPFFTTVFTKEQELHYHQLMCLDDVLQDYHITPEIANTINTYTNNPATATMFQNEEKSPTRQTITSEVVYAMMVGARIPFECQRWNFNRLLVLLRVITNQQTPKKKMSRQDVLAQNARLNAERKKQLNTKG